MIFKQRNSPPKVAFNFRLLEDMPEKKGDLAEHIFRNTIHTLLHANCGLDQINALKQLHQNIKKHAVSFNLSESPCFDLLINMYVYVPLNYQQKKNFHSVFNALCDSQEDFVISSFKRMLKQLRKSIPFIHHIFDTSPVVTTILCLLDSLSFGKQVIYPKLHKICDYLCNHFLRVSDALSLPEAYGKEPQINAACHAMIKIFLLLLQHFKSKFESVFRNVPGQLLLEDRNNSIIKTSVIDAIDNMGKLFQSSHISSNCSISCGLAMATLVRMHPDFDFYSYCQSESIVGETKLKNLSLICKTYLYNGILAVAPFADLVIAKENVPFFRFVLYQLILISRRGSGKTDVTLYCARTMHQWVCRTRELVSSEDESVRSVIFAELRQNETIFEILLQYIFSIWEHYAEGMKYIVADIFEGIIKLHQSVYNIDSDDSSFLRNVCITLLEMPLLCKGKYSLLSRLTNQLGSAILRNCSFTIVRDLYRSLNNVDITSHVSELINALHKKGILEMEIHEFENVFLLFLYESLCTGSKEQRTAILQYILPKLLELNPCIAQLILSKLSPRLTVDTGSSFAAVLTCVKFLRKQTKKNIPLLNYVPEQILTSALCHRNDQIRLSALTAICEAHKTTEPVSAEDLKLLKEALPWNICSQCPAFREQFLAIMKKFFCRLKDSYFTKKMKIEAISNRHTTNYKAFLEYLKDYLVLCFHPGANFPRRVTSLHLLSLLLTVFEPSVLEDLELSFNSTALFHTLLEHLKDTYENNKQLIIDIMDKNYLYDILAQDTDIMTSLFSDAMTLLSSTKPPDTVTSAYIFTLLVKCDSSAKLCEKFVTSKIGHDHVHQQCAQYGKLMMIQALLFILKAQLRVAKTSLLRAAAEGPLYGVLTSLRYVIREISFESVEDPTDFELWQKVFSDLISTCHEVVAVVEPVVCNASPEGHLPMDTDKESILLLQEAVQNALGQRFENAIIEEDDAAETPSDVLSLSLVKCQAVTSQMLLLCSWRTHKEVSLLFGAIAEKVPIMGESEDCQSGFIEVHQLLDIGRYFTKQLSHVKHRGAFEQAYVGFLKMCHRIWRSSINTLKELPQEWLCQLFDMITGNIDKMVLCSSRRSGGLPYMVQALLVSNPNISQSSSFKVTMQSLLTLALAQSDNIDCKVHALNILRALYRDSSLGENVMPFISEGIKAAILGFKSGIWAVRNSATLLLSALVTRIFGVNRSRHGFQRKNCLTMESFLKRFPDLKDFLHDEMHEAVGSMCRKRVDVIPELTFYPILLFLSHLYPSPGEEVNGILQYLEFKRLIFHSSLCCNYKCRALAAKTGASLTMPNDLHGRVHRLFTSSIKQAFLEKLSNDIHGILLQIQHLLFEMCCNQSASLTIDKECLVEYIVMLCWLGTNETMNYATKAVGMKCLCYLLGLCDLSGVTELQILIYSIIKEHEKRTLAPEFHSYLIYSAFVVVIYFSFLDFADASLYFHFTSRCHADEEFNIMRVLQQFLSSSHYEVRSVVLEMLLCVLDSSGTIEYSADEDIFKLFRKNCSGRGRKLLDTVLDYMSHFLVILTVVKEKHFQCLTNLYLLLCKIPRAINHPWVIPEGHLNSPEKLSFVLSQMEKTSRDDIFNAMLVFSGHLVLHLYESLKDIQNSEERNRITDILATWFEEIEDSVHPDNTPERRNTALKVLNVVLGTIMCDKYGILGSKTIPLWRSLVLLLCDDEPDIKNSASDTVVALKQVKCAENVTYSPMVSILSLDICLGLFVDQFGESYPECCISELLAWMLNDSNDTQCIQSDEQPFDRGEMNVYAEDFVLTQVASSYLSNLLRNCKNLENKTIKFNPNPFRKFSSLDGEEIHLSVHQIVSHCLSDLFHIFSTFQYSPFLNRAFDTQLLYLCQRAYVLDCFSQCIPIQSESSESINNFIHLLEEMKYKNTFVLHIELILKKCLL